MPVGRGKTVNVPWSWRAPDVSVIVWARRRRVPEQSIAAPEMGRIAAVDGATAWCRLAAATKEGSMRSMVAPQSRAAVVAVVPTWNGSSRSPEAGRASVAREHRCSVRGVGAVAASAG
jgi:hypothetical protein